LSGSARAAEAPDVTLEIAPYTLEASPNHHIRTGERSEIMKGEELLISAKGRHWREADHG
jgi:hypothetical protein